MFSGSRRTILALFVGLLLVPTFAFASFDRSLSLGMSGTDVSALQTLLAEKGFFHADVTGYYGPVTLQAVADFQKSVGLESLGYVGPLTRAILNGGSSASAVPSSILSSLIASLQQLLRNAGYYQVSLTGTLDQATLQAAQSLSSGSNSVPVRSGGKPQSSSEDEDEVPAADIVAPSISVIASSPSQTTATITWITDEASDSQIEYGTSAAYTASSTLDASSGTSHSVPLSGLISSTLYHFRVLSRDEAGNLATSSDQTFTTSITPDTTAPVLSAIASSTTATTVQITWTTNEAATSVVNYGPTSSYGTASSSAALSTGHTINLSGLSASTPYHFQVRSLDAAGNVATSSDLTFTTSAAADVTAPIISSIASSTASATATITWTTNEASNSRIDYGTTASYGSASTSAALSTSHSVTLTGLTASTTYHFRVQSTDVASNIATSSDLTLRTTGYDVDAQSLFTAMSVTPSDARKELINNLVLSLKSAGVWSKLDTLYVIAAHDAQAARLNWKGNASFTLSAVNSPFFVTDRGYYTDGVSTYLNMNWAPLTNGINYTQNSATLGIWTRNNDLVTSGSGGSGTTAVTLLSPRGTSSILKYRINQAATSDGAAVSSGYGLTAVSRSGATATQAYRNGATSGSAGAIASAALTSVQFNLGRVNGSFAPNEFQAAFTGSNLSPSEHTALYDSLSTYMTAIGVAPLASTTNTFALASATRMPDGASGSIVSKGFTNTGLARDPVDGTWWMGNHGKGTGADPAFLSSVVHLSADFSTIIAEYTAASLGLQAASIQGVAYDTSDNTIWFVVKGTPNQVIHMSKAGSVLATLPSGVSSLNGLAYDIARNQLIGIDTSNVKWYNKSDFSVVPARAFLVEGGDQVSYDSATDTVLVTFGINGQDGTVQYWPVQDNNYGGLWKSRTDTLTGADAIEGVALYNNTLYIANDGYYHNGNLHLNEILTFQR
jgi:hypothetical protein